MVQAHAERTTEAFHAWRKRVKYLRHHMEVLAAVCPDIAPKRAAGFKELGDGLGLDHDLADLETVITEATTASASPAAKRGLKRVADSFLRKREVKTSSSGLAAET